MICDIANAYPSNGVCIDINDTVEFKYTFYGDYAIGHDIYFYDASTGEKLTTIYYDRGENTGGYYNGEEIGNRVVASNFERNKQYMWKARIYNKQINDGSYPDILVTSGTTRKNPIIKTKVIDTYITDIEDDKYIPVDVKLDIDIPAYIFIGDEVRKIVSYKENNGLIEIDETFSTYPDLQTEVIINNVARSNPKIADENRVIYISPENSIIKATKYRPLVSSTDTITNSYIVLNNNYYAILRHDVTNGIITVDDDVSSITENTPFEVYTNYIETPFFNFVAKTTPTVVATTEIMDNWKTIYLKCTAELTNNYSFVAVKSYHWNIYSNINGVETLLERSKEIYSGRLEYLARVIMPDSNYRAEIVVTTRDNVVIRGESNIGWLVNLDGINNLTAKFNPNYNRIELKWNNITNNTSFIILRTDSKGNNEYLETIFKNTTSYYDYKVANNQQYKYYVIPKYGSNTYKSVSVTSMADFNAMSIYFLSEIEYERPPESISTIRIDTNFMYPDSQYKIEKVYNIGINIKEFEITHNIKKNVDVGHTGLPIITNSADNYDSFSLDFIFGNISCDTDDFMDIFTHTHDKYIEWREYVASGLPVLIKDYMGNIWFGTITDHSPTPDTNGEPKLYKISISFVQTKNTGDIRVLSD